GRSQQVRMLAYGKKPHQLACVLSPEEVARLLDAARPGRERVLLKTAYACGLRLMEVLNLQVQDIDSARMLVHVRQGKGNKDRLVPLSLKLLRELRAYWRRYRPARWLFCTQGRQGPVHPATVQRQLRRGGVPAGAPTTGPRRTHRGAPRTPHLRDRGGGGTAARSASA